MHAAATPAEPRTGSLGDRGFLVEIRGGGALCLVGYRDPGSEDPCAEAHSYRETPLEEWGDPA